MVTTVSIAGVIAGLGGGQSIFDAAQVYLRTMILSAYVSAALFVALEWGNSVRMEAARLLRKAFPKKGPPTSAGAEASLGGATPTRKVRRGDNITPFYKSSCGN
eukprot:8570258-Pyramimonas_sp.AAC.1